jgi:beta-glucosidase
MGKYILIKVLKCSLTGSLLITMLLINACQSESEKVEKRIDSIISAMTLEEKIKMLHKDGMFTSAGIPRLGIPELTSADGPFGVREELEKYTWKSLHLRTDSGTFFPTGTALAATWNYDMAYKYGVGIGEETRTRGKNVILGPAVNIARTPVNGRTYEYMSEDPYLNSKIVVGYIKGVQSTGVASCVKHFALNNQETNRGHVSVNIDERTIREIYLPAFKAAVVDADVKCMMSAYNKIRGQYCSENDYLLNKMAKGEWGFKGLIMSDWGGTHSTVDAALNGLDIEMGTDKYFSKALLDSVKSGRVPVSVIDDKVRRILRVILYCQKTTPIPHNSVVATPEHTRLAYEIASQSIVLLKNSADLLPLNAGEIRKIAVIGENATYKHQSGGFGATVKAQHEVTPLDGIKNKVGKFVSVEFVQGYKSVFVEDKNGKGKRPDNRPDTKLIKEAVDAAKSADVAIVVIGTNHNIESEGFDRPNLILPFGQDELVKAVAAANPKTIVVVAAGAPVAMQAIDSVSSAILYSWYNGSEGGTALADVLFGDVNPSGKLPLTFPAKIEDSPAHSLNAYPGDSSVTYKEGILVGYRWFDTKNVQPVYCFGFGLSYTNFTYNELTTDKQSYADKDKIHVSLKVKNTGSRDGYEVVQFYISDMEPKVLKAAKELKAFRKIMVRKGAEENVEVDIKAADLAYFDDSQMKWMISPGKYKIMAGSSSQDIRVSSIITIN